jgi:hypothetical protein
MEVFVVGSRVLGLVENATLVSFTWKPPHAGTWVLSAEIDPMNSIEERDESNNTSEITVDVRPSLHYFGNTPPMAVASVRVGRGFPYTTIGEKALEFLAEQEPPIEELEPLYALEKNVQQLHKVLRAEMERATAGMPALMKRRAITIRQGQIFTLVGGRSMDREHNIEHYCWAGPNVSVSGSNPDVVVDTSKPGMELAPGIHRYRLTVVDEGGLMHTDFVHIVVVRGAANSADLVPAWAAMIPPDAAPGQKVGFHVMVQNQGSAGTSRQFKVKLFVGVTTIAEQTVALPMGGGESCELVFQDCWQATEGRHILNVTVNQDRGVAESDYANNALTVPLNVDGNAAPRAVLSAAEYVVKSGEAVFLDAGPSFDSDGQIVDYEWFIDGNRQQGNRARRIRYEAPAKAGDHVIRLVVIDNRLKPSLPVEAKLSVVKTRELPPVLRLPKWLVVPQGRDLTILGGGCFDPDGSIASFNWELKGAKKVSGKGRDFVIRTKGLKPGCYVAELTVTDNTGGETTGEVPVYIVEDPNRPPMISCPAAVRARNGEKAKIDAGKSYDTDGRVTDFLWFIPKSGQVGNEAVFEADTAGLGIGPHIVVLTVGDDAGATSTRTILLQVLPAKGEPATVDDGWSNGQSVGKEVLEKVDPNGPKPEYEDKGEPEEPPPDKKPPEKKPPDNKPKPLKPKPLDPKDPNEER